MVFTHFFTVQTREKVELINITGRVKEVVEKSDIREGIVLVYTPHTTAGLLVNEPETGLVKDLKELLLMLIPWGKDYAHNRVDNNAPSHLVASILGPSLVFSLSSRRISLGTWQAIFFVELDGPRSRRVEVKIVGE